MSPSIINRYLVKPKASVDLDKWNASESSGFEGDKDEAKDRLGELNQKLEQLQELLYAEHQHKVLIVLQGMDTSGKDGVIRHVFEGVNPQGVRVASFKVPTALEADHDYLWRIHQQTPGKGEIVIFNRSHYEDVLVVRVHRLVKEATWRKRYAHINNFEHLLADEGTTILKFFLHIDKDEQKERLLDRLKQQDKQWKFNVGDLGERKLWSDYQNAYEDVLQKTSTTWAPWYIVPANRKWYRNLVIGEVIVDALQGLKMAYPQPKDDLSKVIIE